MRQLSPLYHFTIASLLLLWIHIPLGNSQTTGTNVRRRQWPRIKFEDFYELSGDGPLIDDNITETYLWTTIVTQIKATVWPTVTRVRVSTPKPKPIVLTSTPVFSCNKYWSQISYTLPSESLSVDPLDSVLQRSSPIYPGPSSAIISALSTSDISKSSKGSLEPSQSYTPNKSVNTFDKLSEHLSTMQYVLSPSLEINSNWYTISSIESSLEISVVQSPGLSEPTPIYWASVSIESDKNSIYVNSLSSSRSRVENMVSTGNPFITRIESSFGSTLMSPKVSEKTMTESSETIDRLESSRMTSRVQMSSGVMASPGLTSPVPHPLCPDGLQSHNPTEATPKPSEEYLIRTVLNSTSNESIAGIRERIDRNISQIYRYAVSRELNRTRDQMAVNTRKLLSKVNYTNIEAKLWDLIVAKDSDQIHVIYYVERDGTLVPYEDAFRTLSHISDQEYSQMIGLQVIHKIKPYNEIKWAKTSLDWWPIAMMAASALVLFLCIVFALVFLAKYRSEKRKWMDAFHSELNRVAPEHRSQWTTVSKLVDQTIPSLPTDRPKVRPKDRPKTANKSSEFQYLSFESKDKQKEAKKKCISKATQMESSLEMQKQKVIPIGKVIDESTDTTDTTERPDRSDSSAHNQYIRSTFVTTREIETKSNDNSIPRIISVQMSAQTESMIRAIRSELDRFGHYSNAVPFADDTQHDQSITSNSSEA